MEKRLEFTGTGGALLGKFLVGMILTGITLGIYMPWFIVSLQKYVAENLSLKAEGGDVKFAFSGTGGGLFKKYLVGVILTMITVGIYAPWFMVNLAKFFEENTSATGADGKSYTFRFEGSGGTLFGAFIVGYLLTVVTIGIYAPWFVVSLNKFFTNNTKLTDGSSVVGTFEFTGSGSELLGTFIVGYLLTVITLGIYSFWFQVTLLKYFYNNTYATVAEKRYKGDFVGTGAQSLGINIVGYLLTMLTLGIYGAWYMCNLLKFQYNNTKVLDA